jgi:hypothetical protein
LVGIGGEVLQHIQRASILLIIIGVLYPCPPSTMVVTKDTGVEHKVLRSTEDVGIVVLFAVLRAKEGYRRQATFLQHAVYMPGITGWSNIRVMCPGNTYGNVQVLVDAP